MAATIKLGIIKYRESDILDESEASLSIDLDSKSSSNGFPDNNNLCCKSIQNVLPSRWHVIVVLNLNQNKLFITSLKWTVLFPFQLLF